jgi:hypothetical protein
MGLGKAVSRQVDVQTVVRRGAKVPEVGDSGRLVREDDGRPSSVIAKLSRSGLASWSNIRSFSIKFMFEPIAVDLVPLGIGCPSQDVMGQHPVADLADAEFH